MMVLGLLDISVWLIVVIIVISTAYLYDVWKHSLWTRIGVPGPKPVPYLGILRSLKEKGTHGTDLELVQKYGKLVGVYNAHLPCLVVADPEIIRQISVKDFSTFPNRYSLFKPLDEFKGAVVSAKNAHWKFIRNTLTPAFSSGKMRMINPLIDACNKRLLTNLEKQSIGNNPVDMKKIFGSYTMDVIASTAFGMDVDSQNDPQNPFVKNAKAFFKLSLSSPVFLLMIIFPVLGRIASMLRIRPKYFMDALMFFKAAVLSAIQMRSSEDSMRKDLLQVMLNARKEEGTNDSSTTKNASHVKERGLTVNEITGNAIVFFLAGYDTTANTLAFMTYCLATNPSCQDKLIAEIDSLILKQTPNYDNVQTLPYLEMVMCETLRLYCPAMRTSRVAEKDAVIGGYTVPKGTEIVFPIYVVHRDPEYWPDPEKFDPERFNDENKGKINPNAFMPFGHGPRNCIGMRLAQMEVKTSIVSILQKYRLVACDETEIPVTIDHNAITLKPKHGIKLMIEER